MSKLRFYWTWIEFDKNNNFLESEHDWFWWVKIKKIYKNVKLCYLQTYIISYTKLFAESCVLVNTQTITPHQRIRGTDLIKTNFIKIHFWRDVVQTVMFTIMSTVSAEPSTSPTPSTHKVNGGINQRLNISTLNASSHKHHHGAISTATPVSMVGHSSTPLHVNLQNASLMTTPGVANITLSSNKPLLDTTRTSIHPGSILDSSRRTPTNITLKEAPCYEGDDDRHGIYQMLASLALLCVLSLMMSFLALFFLQKLGPMMSAVQTLDPLSSERPSAKSAGVTKAPPKRIVVTSEEYATVYQVSVALSTLTISLDLCCLFVCCIQFLFAIKLLKTPQGDER